MQNKVKLISSDGKEFFLDHEVAIQSQILKVFFGRPSMFKESVSRTISLPIKARYLKKAVDFLEHKHSLDPAKDHEEFKIDDTEALDILDIAAYLKI
ncbi:hypothetical protein HK407_04g06560 [Ordospora pajunii]|jgi:hypothetical protein|uniref:uncharacterized protein n=1 Tax=Ordospora pajunii TaxID=3039483 RepID=UPI0029527EF3|nr:uncharacterized protein HK407_04g06560 [Ordospora pajunii]KAH9411554.1 hypothetical protein HK407_04g06560 [Ordospora pajunii]